MSTGRKGRGAGSPIHEYRLYALEVGKIKIRRLLLILCALASLLFLPSCFRVTTDDLYSLPEASDEYMNLQAQLNNIINSGAEYLPPTSGPNRQSVQLKDLDGDGVNEAIAFFYVPGNNPLKIYIFKKEQDNYDIADTIEGSGTAIDDVRYLDMDGNGTLEMVVGWQMSPALKHMTLYSMKGLQHMQIADADYTDLTTANLNGDSRNDLIVMSLPTSATAGQVQVISMLNDGEIAKSSSPLPDEAASFSNVVTGKLSDNVPGIFLDWKDANGSISTCIFSYAASGLKNVTVDYGKAAAARSLTSSTDINGDGIIEVPFPRALAPQSDTTYYVIDWCAFDSSGNRRLALMTYHDYSDGWYLVLPSNWFDKVSIRREDSVSGERTIVFSYIPPGLTNTTPRDFLKIYTLSGANKDERANLPGRFILSSDGDTTYAAELLESPNSFGITFSQSYVQSNFLLIYSNWMSGVT